VDLEKLWTVPVQSVLESLAPQAPVIGMLDDTLIHKRGHHITGTSWRRDPLGPPFATNFIWASRFLQIALVLPAVAGADAGAARAIPIEFEHAPSPRKPSRRAAPQQWEQWRTASAAASISALGARKIRGLRHRLDQLQQGKDRPLWMCGDATFTNRTVLKNLPPRTILIGRIRKDASLYAMPTPQELRQGRGHPRYYGRRLPTPEQIRQDDSLAWQTVHAYAAGQIYPFDIKYLAPLRWKNGSGPRPIVLLIVRPVGYRLRQNHRLNYRNPAYLICTDLTASPQQILQAYLWRWEIEVNFRDEKTLLGVGQPQVRTEAAVRTATAFSVFCYALLLLALHRCRLAHRPFPPPRWHRKTQRHQGRVSTQQALALFRSQLWSSALRFQNKNGFAAHQHSAAKPFLILNSLQSAVLYASG